MTGVRLMTAICGFQARDVGGGADGLDAMLAALVDYGADATTWTEDGVGFGVRTAATEETPPEPRVWFARDAGLALAADARLDDRDTLCAALGVPPPERAAARDGDLLLRAYARWGRDCPHRLLGDYAFAVWDARRRVLFCARDHIGVRPFYYAVTPGGFVFASAVEAVLAAPGVSDALDETVVATFLTDPHTYSRTRTFFEAVRKLPPGHTLTVAGGDVRIEQYWRPEDVPRARPDADDATAEAFLDLYARAVRDRLRNATDPVGTHLSGGLDSSSVAVLAARELRRQNRPAPLAFSWLPRLGAAPPEPAHAPEYALVDTVCRREGLRVFHRSPSPGDVLAFLRRDGAFPNTPVDLNEDVVRRCAAQRGVTVLLSGWGGDEGASFDGRGYDAEMLLTGRWKRFSVSARARNVAPLKLLAWTALHLAYPNSPIYIRRRLRGAGPYRRRWFIDPAFDRRTTPLPALDPRPIGTRRIRNVLVQAGYVSERLEGWAASGARDDVEYRYPLLDRRVLEFALGLPSTCFRRGKWNRWLMRSALSRVPAPDTLTPPAGRAILPPEICWNRSKSDPARHAGLVDASAAALPVVRRALDARITPPARAGYIDMSRLYDRLDADWFRAHPKFAVIFLPLQFLDW